MDRITGHVAELQLLSGEEQVLIACPKEVIPAPGQYLLAAEDGSIQATPLFLAGIWKQGFLATNPYPTSWQPGTELTLFGPLGHGFHLPADVQRLALIALGNTNSRLLPLVSTLKSAHASITLFSDAQSSDLPPDLEAYPIQDLLESLTWADFFAVDAPLESLERLAAIFNKSQHGLSGLRGEILVHTSMPCCGLGKCGVCALRVKRSWKLICEDGPVFDLTGVLKGMSW
ncbi:MAG TPA: hypothetical protein VMW34_12370 [Anaerolineales bacterium]|nr:hypothetical protein [Anaerolineales bacterium]